MTKEDLGFFKGVAITARHALPRTSPGTLASDALNLTSIQTPTRAAQKKGAAPIEDRASLAVSWLEVRAKEPLRTFDPQTFTISVESVRGEVPALKAARAAALHADQSFDDRSLALLFGGAQTGLSVVKPGFSAELLRNDLVNIQAIVPSFDEICAKTGVSRDGVAELIAHEYVTFRLANRSAALHFVSGGFGTGGRYGWLDVYTDPSPADVFIDGSWMAVSPAPLLVATAGTHSVEGKQGGLKAQISAKVPAVQRITVDLKLV